MTRITAAGLGRVGLSNAGRIAVIARGPLPDHGIEAPAAGGLDLTAGLKRARPS